MDPEEDGAEEEEEGAREEEYAAVVRGKKNQLCAVKGRMDAYTTGEKPAAPPQPISTMENVKVEMTKLMESAK